MDDNRIVELFFSREQQALSETEQKYGRYLNAIAFHVLGNREDSEECVNDALLSAWNAIPPTKPTVFRMFLAKLTRNHAINRRKQSDAKKRGGIIQLINDGKAAEGTRITGFGMQGHYGVNAPSVSQFEEAAREYGKVVDKVMNMENVATREDSWDTGLEFIID